MWSPTRPTAAAGTPPTIDFTDTQTTPQSHRNRHRDVIEKNFATSPRLVRGSFAVLGDAILGDELLGALLDIRPRSVQSDHGARFEVEGLGDPGADCCCVHRRTWCCGCTWQGEDQSACLIMSPQIPRRMHPRDMCAAIAPGHWALSPLCTACMATAWARLASRNMGAVMHSLSY
jgi:hypothetical protein